ncbi:NUDIX domain-containing protein [Plastorhodobacter daqingensis]|uniref:NUDIX domain-containing protein n=1 Tax=Plastorhodobacter daqingensis TaxID=1387281 RepID=A0ABW2UHT4_9RHOB
MTSRQIGAPPIRDAASVVLLREGPQGPEVLMGQRGASAAFMPSKFVFPGGAVDAADARVPLADQLPAPCAARLSEGGCSATALAVAAIRELAEETGLLLAQPGAWPDAPPGWEAFAAAGLRPSAAALRFFFRAITPPGRSRRFDARFFLARAEDVAGDADDFSRACDELSSLQWIPLQIVRQFDLPFITEVVLAEVGEILLAGGRIPSVPFFDSSGERSVFRRIA